MATPPGGWSTFNTFGLKADQMLRGRYGVGWMLAAWGVLAIGLIGVALATYWIAAFLFRAG